MKLVVPVPKRLREVLLLPKELLLELMIQIEISKLNVWESDQMKLTETVRTSRLKNSKLLTVKKLLNSLRVDVILILERV